MLALLGLLMIVCFIAAIMTRRISASVGLILMPMVFGLASGHGPELGQMAMKGIATLAPTVVLLLFAVLYFGVMIDAGLFEPLVTRVVRIVGGDPLRIAVGTAVVVVLVALDGDGASTALLTISTFLPIYRRVGMNPLILAVILGAANSMVNLTPWGGPAARVASALHVDPADVFLPLLPTMLIGLASTIALAAYLGWRERQRLGVVNVDNFGSDVHTDGALEGRPSDLARSRLIYVNLVLTLAVMAMGFSKLLPLPVAFMVGFALALSINYPDVATQRKRIAEHAANALPIALLIFGAGTFTGILGGTGMIDAIAKAAGAILPPELGNSMALITACLAGPLTFVLPNDAYYFGVVPVVSSMAAQYDVSALQIARASLLGQPLHALSPLYASIYFVATLLGREVGEMQRFALKWMLLLNAILIAAAVATGGIG